MRDITNWENISDMPVKSQSMKFMWKYTVLSECGCPLEHDQFMVIWKNPDTEKKSKQKVGKWTPGTDLIQHCQTNEWNRNDAGITVFYEAS